MKRVLATCAFLLLGLTAHSPATAQTPATPTGQGARQDRVVGEVATVDAASGALTVKADDGQTVSFAADEKTTYLKVAPGSTSLEGAEKITLADVAVGDRVLVLLRANVEGKVRAARQVIVTSRTELAATREREREAARRRTLTGRVASVDAARREFTVTTRGREGTTEVVTVAAPEAARILRYAPDSLKPADARPATFADLKVGDQVRASGDRSADGARFTPEEILAGSFVRAAGVITDVNASAGAYTVRDEQTGKLYTVGFTKNSALRRVPREVAEEFLRRREEMRQRAEQRRASAEANGGGTDAEREARRAERAARREGEGQRGEGRRRDGEGRGPDGQGRPREGGFGNIQQTLEALPLLAPAELRKGDALLVTGSPDAAGTRVTAASAYTGDPDFLRQLLRIQERRGPGEVNTGLPGDVLGGGNVNRDANTPTPPPR